MTTILVVLGLVALAVAVRRLARRLTAVETRQQGMSLREIEASLRPRGSVEAAPIEAPAPITTNGKRRV